MKFGIMAAVLCGLLVPALAVVPTPAVAESRIALVIANGAYGADMGMLPNPVGDGKLMAQSLTNIGFKVTLVTDGDQKAMKRAISEFGRALTGAGPGSTGLFYYAGHGIQVGGANYLVPIGAVMLGEADVDLEAVPADAVLRQMETSGAQVSIVVLDACRNNPLARSLRSATRGLARMDAPTGSFVAYSTAPGQTAADGDGANSPFATSLAAELAKPGQSIEETFRNVRGSVMAATNKEQVPWDSSSLTAPFYFSEPQVASIAPAPQPAAAPTAPSSNEALFWESIKDSKRASDFDAYLKKYPNGDFTDLARSRAEELKNPAPAVQQQAAVQPAAPSPSADPNALDMAYWNSVKDSRSATDFEAYLKKFPNGEFADLAKSRIGALRSVTPSAAAAAAPTVEPEPEFESPLPDGTIVLSPKVAAMLAEYLKKPKPNYYTVTTGYFFVSEDGHAGGYYVCQQSCFGSIGSSQMDVSDKVREKAKASCSSGAKTPCVMLFTKNNEKRAYKIYGQ